jgi:hypothetical protein
VLSGGAPDGFYRAGWSSCAGRWGPVVVALMAGHFGLEGVREVGSRSGERMRGGVSVTGRGSSSARWPKGEPAVLGRPVEVASVSPEEDDEGSGPSGPSELGG